VLEVLLAHFHPAKKLTTKEQGAIDDLKSLMNDIAAVKKKHPPKT